MNDVSDVVKPAGTAAEMTTRLERLLEDATEIEQWPYQIVGWADGLLGLVGNGERYEIKVVKKR